MDTRTCPYCASTSVRLIEAMVTVRLVERPEVGGFVERKCSIYRCLACERTFDKDKGEEMAEQQEF